MSENLYALFTRYTLNTSRLLSIYGSALKVTVFLAFLLSYIAFLVYKDIFTNAIIAIFSKLLSNDRKVS